MSSAADLTFTCPRCHSEVAETFYGPCGTCRDALRQSQGQVPGGEHLEVAYEPKMNVTPNAVATKE
ncbi:MAG: hypothetical protein ACKV2O_17245 [Acidimicrobiales bacterium]